MLAGRRPFEGRTVSDTLASVLARDADLDALPTDMPTAVRRLLRRCFEKAPKRRLRDIAEGVMQLEDGLSSPPEESTPAALRRSDLRIWQRPAAVVCIAVGSAVIASLAVWSLTRPDPVAGRVERFEIPPPAPITLGLANSDHDVAITPDGTRVVYTTGPGPDQIYVRAVDTLTATPLLGSFVGTAFAPFTSPIAPGWASVTRALKRSRRCRFWADLPSRSAPTTGMVSTGRAGARRRDHLRHQ